MIMTLPNILTMLRMAAAVFLPFCYLFFAHPLADLIALILFVLAAVTDWFDGWIARKFNQSSAFGAMLDPIADKTMVAVALLCLVGLYDGHWIILIPASMIIIREFAVAGMRESLSGSTVSLAVTKLAKWKTTVQMLAITLLLAALYAKFAGIATKCYVFCTRPALGILDLTGVILLWVAAIMTIITGLQYFQKAMPVLLKEPTR